MKSGIESDTEQFLIRSASAMQGKSPKVARNKLLKRILKLWLWLGVGIILCRAGIWIYAGIPVVIFRIYVHLHYLEMWKE